MELTPPLAAVCSPNAAAAVGGSIRKNLISEFDSAEDIGVPLVFVQTCDKASSSSSVVKIAENLVEYEGIRYSVNGAFIRPENCDPEAVGPIPGAGLCRPLIVNALAGLNASLFILSGRTQARASVYKTMDCLICSIADHIDMDGTFEPRLANDVAFMTNDRGYNYRSDRFAVIRKAVTTSIQDSIKRSGIGDKKSELIDVSQNPTNNYTLWMSVVELNLEHAKISDLIALDVQPQCQQSRGHQTKLTRRALHVEMDNQNRPYLQNRRWAFIPGGTEDLRAFAELALDNLQRQRDKLILISVCVITWSSKQESAKKPRATKVGKMNFVLCESATRLIGMFNDCTVTSQIKQKKFVQSLFDNRCHVLIDTSDMAPGSVQRALDYFAAKPENGETEMKNWSFPASADRGCSNSGSADKNVFSTDAKDDFVKLDTNNSAEEQAVLTDGVSEIPNGEKSIEKEFDFADEQMDAESGPGKKELRKSLEFYKEKCAEGYKMAADVSKEAQNMCRIPSPKISIDLTVEQEGRIRKEVVTEVRKCYDEMINRQKKIYSDGLRAAEQSANTRIQIYVEAEKERQERAKKEYKNRIEHLQEQIACLTRAQQENKSAQSKQCVGCSHSRSEIEALKVQLADKTTEINDYKEIVEEASVKFREQESKIYDLEQERSTLMESSRMTAVLSDTPTFERRELVEKSGLSADMNQMDSENGNLKTEIVRLKNLLKQKEEEQQQQSDKTNNDGGLQLIELECKANDLEVNLARERSRADQLEVELKQTLDRAEKAEKLAGTVEEVDSLRGEKNQLTDRIEQMKMEMKADKNLLTETIEQMKVEMKAEGDKNAALSASVEKLQLDNGDLTERLKDTVQCLNAQHEECSDMARKAFEADERVAEHLAIIDQLKIQCTEWEEGRKQSDANILDMQGKLSVVESDCEVAKSEVVSLNDTLAGVKRQLDLVVLEKEKLAADLIQAKKDLETSGSTVAELGGKLTESEKRAEIVRKQLDVSVDVIKERDDQLNQVNLKLKETGDRLAKDAKEKAKQDKEKLALQNDLNLAREKLEEANGECKAANVHVTVLQKSFGDFERRLAVMDQTLNEERAKLVPLTESNAALTKEIEIIRQELRDTKVIMIAKEADLEKVTVREKSLLVQMDALKEKVKQLTSDKHSLDSDVKSKEKETKSVQKELVALQKEYQNRRQSLESEAAMKLQKVQTDLVTITAQKKKMEQDVEAFKNQELENMQTIKTTYEKELADFQSKVETFESEKRRQSDARRVEQSALTGLKAALEEAHKQNKQFEEKLEQCTARASTLTTDNQALVVSSTKLKQEVAQLKANNGELERRLAENSQSPSGKSVSVRTSPSKRTRKSSPLIQEESIEVSPMRATQGAKKLAVADDRKAKNRSTKELANEDAESQFDQKSIAAKETPITKQAKTKAGTATKKGGRSTTRKTVPSEVKEKPGVSTRKRQLKSARNILSDVVSAASVDQLEGVSPSRKAKMIASDGITAVTAYYSNSSATTAPDSLSVNPTSPPPNLKPENALTVDSKTSDVSSSSTQPAVKLPKKRARKRPPVFDPSSSFDDSTDSINEKQKMAKAVADSLYKATVAYGRRKK